jgi:hypothetical protein
MMQWTSEAKEDAHEHGLLVPTHARFKETAEIYASFPLFSV